MRHFLFSNKNNPISEICRCSILIYTSNKEISNIEDKFNLYIMKKLLFSLIILIYVIVTIKLSLYFNKSYFQYLM